jgi:hypothetical protein
MFEDEKNFLFHDSSFSIPPFATKLPSISSIQISSPVASISL